MFFAAFLKVPVNLLGILINNNSLKAFREVLIDTLRKMGWSNMHFTNEGDDKIVWVSAIFGGQSSSCELIAFCEWTRGAPCT